MQVCWVILCISHQIDLLVIWRIDCYALRNKGNVLPSHCTMPAAPVLCTSEGTRVLSYKTRNSSTAVSLKGVLLFLLCHCPLHCMKARKCHCHFKPWWWPLNPSSQRLGVCRRNRIAWFSAPCQLPAEAGFPAVRLPHSGSKATSTSARPASSAAPSCVTRRLRRC